MLLLNTYSANFGLIYWFASYLLFLSFHLCSLIYYLLACVVVVLLFCDLGSHPTNHLYTNGFFRLVWYNKFGIVHCTYLGVSGNNFLNKYSIILSEYIFNVNKLCRPRWNAALRCTSSGSSLFVKYQFRGFPHTKGYLIICCLWLWNEPVMKIPTMWYVRPAKPQAKAYAQSNRTFAGRLIILWLLSYWLNSFWSF